MRFSLRSLMLLTLIVPLVYQMWQATSEYTGPPNGIAYWITIFTTKFMEIK